MYSFKKYSHNGDFISEIPQKFIKNIPTFHETMNSGQWELSLEFNENVSENFLKFWELVKIFYNENLIYSWFVSRREKIFSEKNSIVFYLVGIIDILRNYRRKLLKTYTFSEYDRNISVWKAKTFFAEMIEIMNQNTNIFKFDESKIFDISENHNEWVSWSFLDLLNFFQKKYEMHYFIWADGLLKVWTQEKNHTLLFNKDIFEIKIETEFWEVVNFAEFKAKYILYDNSWLHNTEEYISVKDEESIKKIWLKYKEFPSKHFWTVLVRDYDNFHENIAKKHIRDILEKAKNPFLNIKLKIFDKKYFWVLKVLDTLTIKNFSEEIENKKIVKISYNENYMEVELENYNILWNIILWQ